MSADVAAISRRAYPNDNDNEDDRIKLVIYWMEKREAIASIESKMRIIGTWRIDDDANKRTQVPFNLECDARWMSSRKLRQKKCYKN